jgi:hypothetical protein
VAAEAEAPSPSGPRRSSSGTSGGGRRRGITELVPLGRRSPTADPASIVTSAERLARKRGSEAMGRCPSEADAVAAAEWLVDRLSRLAPSLDVESRIQAGGGQYLVVLTS